VGTREDDRQGILPNGTELTPLNPMTAGNLPGSRRRAPLEHALDRGEETLQPHGRGLRGLLRVHRRAARPVDRLPGGVRPARQHADLLLRRQRRVRRRKPNGSVNENRFFNGYPTTSSPTWR
jgi:arylsulfatase